MNCAKVKVLVQSVAVAGMGVVVQIGAVLAACETMLNASNNPTIKKETFNIRISYNSFAERPSPFVHDFRYSTILQQVLPLKYLF
ncbi:MAG: hypothetical protein ABSH44_13180 [Bryobacteraceae bacterium]